jgi:hypothetical protein
MMDKKLSPEEIRAIPKAELRKMIDKVRSRIKNNEIVQNMFKEYDVNLDEIDLVPIAFADLDVSARTDHAIIYLNYRLLSDGSFENNDHYLIHELTHYLQQTTGTKPTKGADDGNYLDNEYEKEGFQNQTEYISETRGDDVAEKYVEKVLDHHEVNDKKERNKRKLELLNLASSIESD